MEVKIADIKIVSNSRTTFDADELKELAQSIKEVGLINPITITKSGKGYDLVAGERRLRAVRDILKLSVIKAEVIEGTEDLLHEIHLVENLQRADLSPVEEANGFIALANNKTRALTASEIANKVGKPLVYVAKRLKFSNLLPKALKRLGKEHSKLTFEGALELALVSHKLQEAYLKARDGWVVTAADVKTWLARYAHANLSQASFNIKDAKLLESVGACTVCDKRSSKDVLFSEDRIDRCLDSSCFVLKTKEAMKTRVKVLTTEYGEVALINNSGTEKKTDFGTTTAKDHYVVSKDTEGAVPVINVDNDLSHVIYVKFGKKRDAGKDVKVDPKEAYEKRMHNIELGMHKETIRASIKMIYNNELRATVNDKIFMNTLASDIFNRLNGQDIQLLARCIGFDPMTTSKTEKLLISKFVKSEDERVRFNLLVLMLFLHPEYDGNPGLRSFQEFSATFTKIYGASAFKDIHNKTTESFKTKLEKAKAILKGKDKKK
jgi:ParB/RepB/Spo0J family partition protein